MVLVRLLFSLGAAAVLALSVPSATAAQDSENPERAAADVGDPAAVELLPGDALQVEIWREEDLSGEFVVNHDGVVVLPMLGPVEVKGLSIRELREELVERYERDLRNPSIAITPLRRVYVLGEVNQPGRYPVDPTTSLAGAIAEAGGANPEGDLGDIQILRDGQVLTADVEPEMDLMAVDIRSGDQIFVGKESWFERHSTFLVSTSIGVASILVQLLR